jgi:uncharacterized protein YecT (DUF1311 family)
MQNRRQLTLWVIVVLACAPLLAAQANSTTPDQNSSKAAHVKDWREFSTQVQEFKKLGRAAYLEEEAREKKGDCPEARSTYEINICLGKEAGKTAANYKTYTDALRSVEGLASPGESDVAGPTGKPLAPEQRLKEFDTVESTWHAYYVAQCSAAYDAYQGGTIAPSMDLTCRLRLMRDRMHELESIFQFMH